MQKTGFASGKTDWDDQHFQAVDEITRDLKKILNSKSNFLSSVNSILEWELFKTAAVHKVAEIAFNAYGDDFKDNREQARLYYREALNFGLYKLDSNRNTRLDASESFPSTFVVRR